MATNSQEILVLHGDNHQTLPVNPITTNNDYIIKLPADLKLSDAQIQKMVLQTHSTDGQKNFNADDLFSIVKRILDDAKPSIPNVLTRNSNISGSAATDEVDGGSGGAPVSLGPLAPIINKLSCVMGCQCSGEETVTMDILKTLSKYSWDEKTVLTMAAFAVNYGQFGLFAQLYSTNALAKHIVLLKQLPSVLQLAKEFKQQFDGMNDLVDAVKELTRLIIDFNNVEFKYPTFVSPDRSPLKDAIVEFPLATFWIIHSLVVCAAQISRFVGFTAAPPNDLTWVQCLVLKIKSLIKKFQEIYKAVQKEIDDGQNVAEYEDIVNIIEGADQHKNNIEVIKILTNLGDASQSVVDSSRRPVAIEELRQKTLLLLISGLDIAREDIEVLSKWYEERNPGSQYQILWVPIVKTPNQEAYSELQKLMPWYTVKDPSLIRPAMKEYITKKWNFSGNTIVVPLDPYGKVQSLNGLNLLWIWGNSAYPFTNAKEDELWKKTTSPFDLLLGGIDEEALSWVAKAEDIVCFYGGRHFEWVKSFTDAAKAAAEVAGVKLHFVYVGKDSKILNATSAEADHKYGKSWSELFSKLFWTRVNAIWNSQAKYDRNLHQNITQAIITLLSLEGTERGWAIFCQGPSQLVSGKDYDIVGSLDKAQEWYDPAKGWFTSLEIHSKDAPHCCCITLPVNSLEFGSPPKCTCGKIMSKHITYRCCDD